MQPAPRDRQADLDTLYRHLQMLHKALADANRDLHMAQTFMAVVMADSRYLAAKYLV